MDESTQNQLRTEADLQSFAASLGFVDQYYQMDIEKEDILFDGTELRNEMVILIADPEKRYGIRAGMGAGEAYAAREMNRWCKVSRLEVTPETENARFFATYEDGLKIKREVSSRWPWLVKRDSIPDIAEEEVAARKEIVTLLRDELNKMGIPDIAEEEYAERKQATCPNAVDDPKHTICWRCDPNNSGPKISYPYMEGDTVVLGPECIMRPGTRTELNVICYQGENYYPLSDKRKYEDNFMHENDVLTTPEVQVEKEMKRMGAPIKTMSLSEALLDL